MPDAACRPGRTGNITMDTDTTGCVNSISNAGDKGSQAQKEEA